MKSLFSNFFLICFLSVVFVIMPVFSVGAATKAYNEFKTNLNDTATGTGHSGLDIAKGDPESIAAKIISALLSFLGVIFLGLMIYGGFLWMTDAGNEDKAKQAKNIIVNAVIGLVVVMAAYAASYFLISAFASGGVLRTPGN